MAAEVSEPAVMEANNVPDDPSNPDYIRPQTVAGTSKSVNTMNITLPEKSCLTLLYKKLRKTKDVKQGSYHVHCCHFESWWGQQ